MLNGSIAMALFQEFPRSKNFGRADGRFLNLFLGTMMVFVAMLTGNQE